MRVIPFVSLLALVFLASSCGVVEPEAEGVSRFIENHREALREFSEELSALAEGDEFRLLTSRRLDGDLRLRWESEHTWRCCDELLSPQACEMLNTIHRSFPQSAGVLVKRNCVEIGLYGFGWVTSTTTRIAMQRTLREGEAAGCVAPRVTVDGERAEQLPDGWTYYLQIQP